VPHSNPRVTTLGLLGPLDGARIPGGCDQCEAYQTAEPMRAGVWTITVHHDDWCPRLPSPQADENV
jgi:hypothetical protein